MTSKVSNSHVNIGTGTSISILELANMMIEESGLDLEWINAPLSPWAITDEDAHSGFYSFKSGPCKNI